MKNRWCAAIVAWSMLVGGCGGGGVSTVTLEGAVSVDGTPAEKGLISFTPLKSGAGKAVSAEIRDGRYRAEKVPVGRVLAQFNAVKETGKMIQDNDPAEAGASYPETINLIPQKHRSGVEITLSETETKHDFALTSQ